MTIGNQEPKRSPVSKGGCHIMFNAMVGNVVSGAMNNDVSGPNT